MDLTANGLYAKLEDVLTREWNTGWESDPEILKVAAYDVVSGLNGAPFGQLCRIIEEFGIVDWDVPDYLYFYAQSPRALLLECLALYLATMKATNTLPPKNTIGGAIRQKLEWIKGTWIKGI